MTKFKNKDWTVGGDKILQKAFVEKLSDKGIHYYHSMDELSYYLSKYPYLTFIGKGKVQHGYGMKTKHFNLPEQWNEALKHVLEKDAPEYVECIENAYPIEEGDICKVDNGIIRSSKYAHSHAKFIWPDDHGSFNPSTKEAYLEQFGVKVGDELNANVISKWESVGSNGWSGHRWQPSNAEFEGNRKVEKLDVIDNKPAMLVSETQNVWLAVEGFKEFEKEQLKSKLIPGKWYKGIGSVGTNFLGVYDGRQINYGFWGGEWSKNLIEPTRRTLTEPATDKEVEEALVKEAKKRGYKNRTKIKSFCTPGFSMLSETGSTRIQGNDFYCMGCVVNRDGKWAEIIPSGPDIVINDYKAEFHENIVKFGCAEIHKQQFIDIYNVFRTKSYPGQNRGIKAVRIGKGLFTVEQITEIAKYYLKD